MENIRHKLSKGKKKIILIMCVVLICIAVLVVTTKYFPDICYNYVHSEGDGYLIYKEYAIDMEKRDYVLVPGGAIPDGYPGTQLSRRLDGAIYMLEEELTDKIIISGNSYEVKAMQKYLKNHDVENKYIVSDQYSEDTLDTITRAKQYDPDAKFYICTQEFYSYRTGYFIGETGIDAMIVNSDLIIFHTTEDVKKREYYAASKAVLETKLFKLSPTKDVDEYQMEEGV